MMGEGGPFKDRQEAGRRLAAALKGYKGKSAVIYALPRGGVVIGAQISKALNLPLDLIIARKIGHPFQPEYAIAAVTESGALASRKDELAALDQEWFKTAVESERAEAARRRLVYLKDRAPISARGKTAILVDDGIATGLTMKAAIYELKKHDPAKIIIAVPVALGNAEEELSREVDSFVSLSHPHSVSISQSYDNFPQVEDEEVIRWLQGEGAK